MNSLLKEQIEKYLVDIEPQQLESMRDFFDAVSAYYDKNEVKTNQEANQSAAANREAIAILKRAMQTYAPANSYTSYVLHSNPRQEVIRLANLVSGIINDYKNNTDELKNQKDTADKLSHELQIFKLAVDYSADLITFFDENFKFIYANKTALADTGFGDIIGKSISEVGAKITSQQDLNNYLDHLKNNEDSFISEMTVDGPLGEPSVFQTMTTVIHDMNNYKIGINISRDITKEKALKLQKDEFISIASHELRTPMTIILGYISLLQRGQIGPISDEQKNVLEKINRSSKTLIKMINDMLDLSKLESGSLEMNLSDCNIDNLISKTLEDMKLLFESKKLSVNYSKNDFIVSTDEEKFRRVLANLLDNAYKFTPEGGNITISSEPNFTNNTLTICVADNGIGIPTASQQNLFKKFSQVNSVLKRKNEGTGLGLSICKDIIEKLGGTIWVKSSPESGSKFYITVPMSQQSLDNNTNNGV